ncbi:antibiotic biosynthesis monooxygenase [Streptomyces hygroscopicus subsp. hygroscopicus]|nr:antibiotic biosynthesis monooxygenase [Streptomyces hygroscopicus subsp. hygroscopicus]
MTYHRRMIFIVVKFPVKPEHADEWPKHVEAFTQATRAEAGNLWFEWSRSLEDPNTYVLVEAFQDGTGEAHVNSDHFRAGLEAMRPLLRRTPDIVSTTIAGADGWGAMGELTID